MLKFTFWNNFYIFLIFFWTVLCLQYERVEWLYSSLFCYSPFRTHPNEARSHHIHTAIELSRRESCSRAWCCQFNLKFNFSNVNSISTHQIQFQHYRGIFIATLPITKLTSSTTTTSTITTSTTTKITMTKIISSTNQQRN